MYLIQKKLAGIEIPISLPPSLVPPSKRANIISPFSPAATSYPQPIDAVGDLLGDATPPNSAVPSHSTGQALTSFSSIPATHISPRPTGDHLTASSSLYSPRQHRDLLGDDDDDGHTSPPLRDQSAEIGNVQNQLNSNTRSANALKAERMALEATLANQASQLSALQTQLSSAKAACETETGLLSTMKGRQAVQAAEIQKSREELIRAESDLSAVRVEKSELEGLFMRDKEDARELHRKMVEVGQQIEVLKTEVEKVKKDAKQQKGLLAIAKKQLSSKEAERANVEMELEGAKAEVASIDKERADAEVELATLSSRPIPRAASSDSLTLAAAHPLPVSPDASTPNALNGVGKSNNPFEGLLGAPSTTTSTSPFLPFVPTSVLDLFGFAEPVQSDPQRLDTPNGKEEPSRKPTPKPTSIEVQSTSDPESIFSASTFEGDNDHFVTPPTSTTHEHSKTSSPIPLNPASPTPEFPGLDELASKFPDLHAEDKTIRFLPSASKQQPEQTATDLGTALNELEVEESDSDSEDEVPLAQLTKPKANDEPPSLSIETPLTQSEVPSTSFDDVFGVASPAPITVSGDVGRDNNATASPATLSDQGFTSLFNTTVHTEPTVAGVTAFDEAMGTIPISSSGAPHSFTFDSAFDDNFDFASAAKESHAPSAVPQSKEPQKTEGLDTWFSAPTKSDSTLARLQEPATPLVTSTSKPSFDEVVSGPEAPSQDMDSSFTSTVSSTNATSIWKTSPSSPTSQTSTPPRNLAPHSSIARPKSPPPRASSPKTRPSTSSSKEIQEKPKELTTKHSKLSVSQLVLIFHLLH